RFEHVFVMGLAEGLFPAKAEDNSIIDFYERKLLVKEGIEFEDAAEVTRWESLSFYFLLLTAAGNLQLSFPQTIGVEEKIKSSFFDRLDLEPEQFVSNAAASVEEIRRFSLRSELFNDDAVLVAARERVAIEMERESPNACGEYDGLIAEAIDHRSRKWSVSQLTSLGQCGFKWFAKKLLRLGPQEEMDDGLSPLTRGNLYHKSLELAFRKAQGQSDMRSKLLEVLDESFAEAEADEEKVALPVLPNWEMRRFEHVETLRQAIRSNDFVLDGSEIVSAEQAYSAEWEGFRLRGSIDRIDRTPDGLVAIDYKTSSSAPPGVQNEEGKAKVDLQLPIYINVALPSLFPNERLSKGIYYSITKGKQIKSVKAEIEPELTAFAERAKAILESGNFAVGPDMDQTACAYCDYDSVCRNGHRITRKGAAK
ncbi:MAG: PD-(D/E)XK nuclease family protein, partial [Pyrinomonadaceae bacterium]